ncbi:cation:proton antiporter [Thiotrichales bacterium 19X7-9]|nr:cation:proton antiporter [Thiotrichales bacterium 19X7-9]TNF67516.1 MAG: cation:proton antiporter [Gammaproteobacteria bacterium]UTW42969.1 cation:proton antiporter [bacterium SCSIO 12844]
MEHTGLIFTFFLIFFGASIFATVALYTRQAIIVAYIALGMLVGPYGLKFVQSTEMISEVSDFGIMFLLFLLGLHLQLKSLIEMLNKMVIITVVSSLVFATITIVICYEFGFSFVESLLVGVCMIFSSTIICLKLMPTTALHHQRIGNIAIGILLLQDIIAIFMLTVLDLLTTGATEFNWWRLLMMFIALPVLVLIAYYAEKFILFKLLRKFNRYKEYIFLVAIGWCLGMSQLATTLGISSEIGAFIAGVTIANSPISQYISENLKPLRDFFLIIFFFSVGAGFNFPLIIDVWQVVLLLTVIIMIIKPIVYGALFAIFGEKKKTALEIGVRLGQGSEFSLLLGFMAFQASVLTSQSYTVIQAVTILTFIISSYIVVLFYPNPIAIFDRLRRD